MEKKRTQKTKLFNVGLILLCVASLCLKAILRPTPLLSIWGHFLRLSTTFPTSQPMTQSDTFMGWYLGSKIQHTSPHTRWKASHFSYHKGILYLIVLFHTSCWSWSLGIICENIILLAFLGRVISSATTQSRCHDMTTCLIKNKVLWFPRHVHISTWLVQSL